jgi:DNA-binding transcriptional LysR family regulator
LEANQLHAGIVSVRARLPAGLEIAHHFEDDFVLVAPPDAPLAEKTATLREILSATAPRDWVLLDERSTTGRLLRRWLSAQGAEVRPVMEADTFDLIINLVTLGLGWSLVPKRALPLYPRARALRRVTLKPKLSRELAIVVRKDRARPEHVRWFVESILFGGDAASGSR